MLAINTSAEGLVTDAVMAAHVGSMAMTEDKIFHKLILISVLHQPYVGYLNNNHGRALQ